MKLTARIAFCLTLLAGSLIATTVYLLRSMDTIHSINRELAATKWEAGRLAMDLFQSIDALREFGAKSLLADPDYVKQWTEWETATWTELQSLENLHLSGAEAVHAADVWLAWLRYESLVAPSRIDGVLPTDPETAVQELDRVLDHMWAATEALRAANAASIRADTEASVHAVDRARQIAWLAGSGSLVLTLVLSLFLYLSISGPLRRLNRGTREIARGNFTHRLEAAGPKELAELARDFNDMAGKLGELEEMKKDFISHVSHELKGPLAAIHETIVILLDRIPGPITSKQQRLLELSHASARRLSAMITNLLELSRLDNGTVRYHFEMHDVVELTREVMAEIAPLARRKALQLQLASKTPAALSCDAERVREVVANLIGNAVKFSPPGAPIRVSWVALDTFPATTPAAWLGTPARPPFFLLTVEDVGPGVPDAHKQGIFQDFYQVARHTRRRGQGVGLGLAICRKIVDAHGGAIWVEDGPERGSRFRVLFPSSNNGSSAAAHPFRGPGRAEPTHAQAQAIVVNKTAALG